jgi:hypothetical protein
MIEEIPWFYKKQEAILAFMGYGRVQSHTLICMNKMLRYPEFVAMTKAVTRKTSKLSYTSMVYFTWESYLDKTGYITHTPPESAGDADLSFSSCLSSTTGLEC